MFLEQEGKAEESRTRLALEGACVATALRTVRAVFHRASMEQAQIADVELEHGDEWFKRADTKAATAAGVGERP